jgi:hypothetical protein
MERKQWQQFLVHACIVCLGLALETFYPVVKIALCNSVIHQLLPANPPKPDNLTAQFGINLSLEPVLKRIEADAAKYESWGDYPEDSHPNLG